MVTRPWSSCRLSCGERLLWRCDGNPRNSFPPTYRGAPFLPHSSRRGILSLCVGKEFLGFPSHLQRRRSPQERREELQGGATIPRVPQISQSIPGKPVFPAVPRLSSRGSTHTMVARGTALWESLVGKPRGKSSRESHRSLDPRQGKGNTAATAREESARECPHSRQGLTLPRRLQKYPKVHVSTGEEYSGSGTVSTQGLGPQHLWRGIPRGPRATRMGTGLS